MKSSYQFKNKFLFLRHGESFSNRDDMIVSSPEKGLDQYPLTGKGVAEVAEVALATYLDSSVKIYCSDFLRTTQTAGIFADVLDAKSPIQTELLRERFFGEWEGTSSENYQKVWLDDEQGECHHQVEPVEQVLIRMVSFLWSIENQFSKQSVLVVSHGDCLQILLAWFQGYEAQHHRKMAPIQTANMRSLNNVRTLEEIQQLMNVTQDHAA